MAQIQDQVCLILVHGGASSNRMYSKMEPILKDKYHYSNIIIPDLPGHGKAVKTGPFSFEKSTQALFNLIQDIKSSHPSAKISVVGVSLGGQAVLELISHHPSAVDAAIVASCSIMPPDAETSWAMPRLPTDDPTWMQIIMEDAGLLTTEDLQALQKLSLNFEFNLPSQQRTSAPILIVRGQHDMPMPFRDFDLLVQKAKDYSTSEKTRGQELVGAWHNHPIDVPDAFAELVDLWNRGVFAT